MLQDVNAVLLLEARLDKVYATISKALDTIDANPNLLSGLAQSVQGLLNSTVNSLGQTVDTFVDSTGNLITKVS